MNKHLLFSALLAATVGTAEAQAQKVSAPSLPSPTQLKLDGTDTVYVYNVKAEKWLTYGNAYSTQTSLDSVGMQIAFVQNKEGKTWNGTFTLVNNSNGSFGRKIFANSFVADQTDSQYGGTSYVDYNNQGIAKTYWEVYQDGDTFELQADTTANLSDTHGTRAGWRPNDTVNGQGNEATSGVFRPALDLSAEDASEYGIKWQAFDRETAERYFTRKYTLMPAINDAIDAGEVDVTKAIAVYNNADATAQELKDAAQYIKDMQRNLTLAEASGDNPLDITEYLANADCDALTGWTRSCVYDSNGNVGSGGHGTNWQNQSATYSTADGSFTTSKFIERWINSSSNPDTNNEAGTGHLSDGSLSQQLSNLPKGGYKLSCYAMATNQARDGVAVEGISLYAKQGDKEYSAKVSTAVGVPEKFDFLLSVDDSGEPLEVGFKIDNTDANWIFVDNFQLVYYGQDAKVMNLMDMQQTATDLDDWMSGNDAYCSQYTDQAYELIEAAGEMTTSADEESISEMKTKLVEIKSTIESSLEKYVELTELDNEIQDFIGDGGTFTDEMSSLYNDGGSYGEGVESVLVTYSYDNDTMDKFMAELKEAFAVSRKNSIVKDTDLTYMLTNPSFENASNGWTNTGGTVSSAYQNSEAYQTTFNMYQELTGMKEGVYELTAQTMSRMTWNADTKTAHDNGSEVINAELYANDISSKFASQFDAYSLNKVDNEYSYEEDGETRYVPNSMKAFMSICAENDNNYLTKVKVYVEEGGTLRIGVRETTLPAGSSDGSWCIWDNFKLKYVGNDAETMSEVAKPVIAKAKALYDSKMSADSLGALKAAVETLEADVTSANIKLVAAATTAAESSISAYEPLNTAIENVKQRYETNESTSKTSDEAKAIYNAALETAENAYNNGTVEDAKISDAVEALNEAFTKYVINDVVATASEDNHADVSKAIVNNDFATMDGTGWTALVGTPGFQSGNNVEAAEFYNSTFNYQQKVVGLPAGTYYLKVKGFYRNGNSTTATIDDESEELKYNVNNNAFAYVADGSDFAEASKKDSVALKPITAAVVAEENLDTYVAMGSTDGLTAFGEGYIPNTMSTAQSFFNSEQIGDNFTTDAIKYIYDGKSDFYVGIIKTVAESADWTIVSNFILEYAGSKEYTDGIGGIVENADVVSTKIYTVNGMQVSKLQKGINIIETVLKNGTKKVKKLIVK